MMYCRKNLDEIFCEKNILLKINMSNNRNTVYIPTFIVVIVLSIFSILFFHIYRDTLKHLFLYNLTSTEEKISFFRKFLRVFCLLAYCIIGIIISYSIELSFDKSEKPGNDTTLLSNILFIFMIGVSLCFFYMLLQTLKHKLMSSFERQQKRIKTRRKQ